MKDEKKKFYQKGWFLWLMLILIPPVGIILLWACHKKMNKVIKIVLAVIFAFWFLLLVIGMSGSGTNDDKVVLEEQTEEKTEKDLEESEKIEQEIESEIQSENVGNSSDEFMKDVTYILNGSDDAIEDISDILYENGDLCVYVDLSQIDPSPLTYEALALVSATQITDRILQQLPEYDDLWDMITIDFGNIGYAKFTKDDIMGEGYTRCFDMANFELIID